MKKFKRSAGIILALMISGFLVKAQDAALNQIQTAFQNYQAEVFQEKVFVHTDRDFYLAGDLLWFKAYVTHAVTNKPSVLSKVLYVEILDKESKPLVQTKVSLDQGLGNGSLFLPVSANSGQFVLRAYTSWMENSGADLFFEKRLTIINSMETPAEKTPSATAYDVQFFPEGGNLIAGLENRVAFRVADQSGAGVSVTGFLLDGNKDTVARFSPLKSGIGSFTFTPRPNTSYSAAIKPSAAKAGLTVDLPSVLNSGYSMMVQAGNAGQLNVRIGVAGASAGPVYLLAHSGGKVTYAARSIPDNGRAVFSIAAGKLGEGISHLTVFDAELRPVSERLYFNRPQRKLDISLSADKPVYRQRDKIDVDISSLIQASPAEADMSVSVYRADAELMQPADIFQYQWLVSELKGGIEDPAFYFQENNTEADKALDNLMLTQGWRRFQWNDVLKGQSPALTFLPEFEGHIISGRVTDRRTGNPASGIMTFLSIPSKRTQLYASRSDAQGRVRFFTKDMIGPGEVVVQTDVQQDSTYLVEIDNPFSEAPMYTKAGELNGMPVRRAVLQEDHISTQVQNIFTANKLRTFLLPEVDSTSFYGEPENVYRLDEYVRFKTTEEVLREYVPAVVLFRQRDNFSVIVDKRGAGGPVGSVPLLLLDGVPIFDRGNKIMAYDPAKIEKLEVLTENSFLGDTAFNSIVSFTSSKGNLEAFELDPRDLVLDYEGLQLQREFYAPVYETEAQRASRLPDLRHLLFWSPEVRSGADGKTSISFYSSDEPGKYNIVVQGLSADGQGGSEIVTIEVK